MTILYIISAKNICDVIILAQIILVFRSAPIIATPLIMVCFSTSSNIYELCLILWLLLLEQLHGKNKDGVLDFIRNGYMPSLQPQGQVIQVI